MAVFGPGAEDEIKAGDDDPEQGERTEKIQKAARANIGFQRVGWAAVFVEDRIGRGGDGRVFIRGGGRLTGCGSVLSDGRGLGCEVARRGQWGGRVRRLKLRLCGRGLRGRGPSLKTEFRAREGLIVNVLLRRDLTVEPGEVIPHECALAEEFLKAVGHAGWGNAQAEQRGLATHKKSAGLASGAKFNAERGLRR